MNDSALVTKMKADLVDIDGLIAIRFDEVPESDQLRVRQRNILLSLESREQYPTLLADYQRVGANHRRAQASQRALKATVAELTSELASAEAELSAELSSFGDRQLDARISGAKGKGDSAGAETIATLQAKVAGARATLTAAANREADLSLQVESLRGESSDALRNFLVCRSRYMNLRYLEAVELLMPHAAAYQHAMRLTGEGFQTSFELRPTEEAQLEAAQAFELEMGGESR